MEINKIHCIDALQGLKQCANESINLIIVDPPYGIDYYSNHGSKEYKEKQEVLFK